MPTSVEYLGFKVKKLKKRYVSARTLQSIFQQYEHCLREKHTKFSALDDQSKGTVVNWDFPSFHGISRMLTAL